MWSSHIVNHFWYCCRTCGGDAETLKVCTTIYDFKITLSFGNLILNTVQVNWASLLHHVTNEHEWIGGKCVHEELTDLPTDQDGRELEYFSKAEPAFRALQKLILDKRWMKSLKFYVNFRSVLVILESCIDNNIMCKYILPGTQGCWNPSTACC